MPEPARLTVLLVEDSETDAELCIRTLRKRGFSNDIVWVKDGAAALDFIFDGPTGAEPGNPPSLILLDLHLPKVSGQEVLSRVKADARTNNIPVVVLTSSREDIDIVRSYELGVNSFICKPVAFDALIETVTRIGLYWLVTNQPPLPMKRPE
jgi:two-component system, response regulator